MNTGQTETGERGISGIPATPSVGLVLRRPPRSGHLDPFYLEFTRGVESILAARGWSLLLQVQVSMADELASLRRWADSASIRGVLIVDLRAEDPRVPLLRELGLPAVVVGEPQLATGFPAVWTDDRTAMHNALEYLLGLGHRRIGRIAGPSELFHTVRRSEVFVSDLETAGAQGLLREGNYSEASGLSRTLELLRMPVDRRPTAIIYDNDLMALGGLDAARSLDLAVPGDVSILAWDDSLRCQLADVSALSHNLAAYGELAAAGLLDYLDTGTVSSSPAELPALAARSTTAEARVGRLEAAN